MNLTKKEKEDIYISISCRLGVIETGEGGLRAEDAIRSGQEHRVRALSVEQRKLIVELEELMLKMLN